MHVSRTLDYAVRSLAFLGNKRDGEVSYMKEISESQNIPRGYLAKVMRQLVINGIVRSMVGPDGGYILARKPQDISMMEIYEAVMGRLKIIDCLDEDFKCSFGKNCAQVLIWGRLQNSVADVLKKTRLNDIIRQKGRKRS